MPLLRPKSERRNKGLPPYRTIQCPMNGHQISWCMGLCKPIGKLGHCGRLAPHAMIGRTQAAIMAYQNAQTSLPVSSG